MVLRNLKKISQIGRTYMFNQITTFLGIAGNIPSNNSIKNHFSGLNYLKIDNAGNVMSLSSSYSYYSIGHFYDAMNYHTPTQSTLAFSEWGGC